MSHISWWLAACLAFGLALSSPSALAQDADTAKVDQLLEVMRARDMTSETLTQVEQMQQQLLERAHAGAADPERKARIDAAMARSNQQLRELMSWENVAPMYRRIYAQTFSDEDIEAMLAFYSSPSGQRVLERMPQLVLNTMTATQELVLPLLQKMEQELQDAMLAQ